METEGGDSFVAISHDIFQAISGNITQHQLCWGDWEIETRISRRKCSQVAGLIPMVETSLHMTP